MDIAAGNDFLGLFEQKISYKRVSSLDGYWITAACTVEGKDYWK